MASRETHIVWGFGWFLPVVLKDQRQDCSGHVSPFPLTRTLASSLLISLQFLTVAELTLVSEPLHSFSFSQFRPHCLTPTWQMWIESEVS